MNQHPRQSTTVPPILVAGLVLLCLGVVIYLLPNDRKLVERQIRDGAPERALKTITGLTPEARKKNAEFYAQAEIESRTALLSKNPTSAVEALALALKYQAEFPHLKTWDTVIEKILQHVEGVGEVYQAILPQLPSMPDSTRRKLLATLVGRALAIGKPEDAAEIQTKLFSFTNIEPDLVETIRLWRMAGKSGEGLMLLNAFIQGNQNVSRDLRFLQVELLHESGQPEKAYAILSELGRDQALNDKQFQLQVQLARETSQVKDLLPLLKERLQKNPNDKNWLLMVAELAQAADDLPAATHARLKLAELDPKDGEQLHRAAQMLEWQNQSSVAFNHYLEAWNRGYTQSLVRLLALFSGVYKALELATTLDKTDISHFPAECLPKVADLMLEAGLYEKAAQVLAKITSLNPSDHLSAERHAWLLVDILFYERALAIFQDLMKSQPDNLNHVRGAAECLFRLDRPLAAVPLYEKLAYEGKDPKMIENYVVLSSSLGLLGNIPKVLEHKIANFSSKTGHDFRRLAHAYNMAGQTNEMVQALVRGVTAFPADTQLQLAAFYALGAKGDVEAASKLLAKNPAVKVEPDLAQLYLGMLMRAQKYPEAEKFVKSGLSKAVLESPAMMEINAELAERRQDLAGAALAYKTLWDRNPSDTRSAMNYARLLVRNGKSKEAEQLLSRFLDPKVPETFKFAAEVYSAAGKYKLAEKYQDLYIKSEPAELPQAHGFLGDIRLSRGDKINAKRAYKRGLDALLEQVNQAPGNTEQASNL